MVIETQYYPRIASLEEVSWADYLVDSHPDPESVPHLLIASLTV
jgi:hypothetical protein